MPRRKTGPDEWPKLDSPEETPAKFRQDTAKRLQKLTGQLLTRLETEAARIPIQSVPVQLGIVLTKYAEISGSAPPASVHNQVTIVNGIDQAQARAILADRTVHRRGFRWTGPQGGNAPHPDHSGQGRALTESGQETGQGAEPVNGSGSDPGQGAGIAPNFSVTTETSPGPGPSAPDPEPAPVPFRLIRRPDPVPESTETASNPGPLSSFGHSEPVPSSGQSLA